MFMFSFSPHTLKRRKTSRKVKGTISSPSDQNVVVKINGGVAPYRKGQHLVVSIPQKRKTASGEMLKISEVVAHGRITDISQNTVTIDSKLSSPIISRSALNANLGKERLLIVDNLDE